MSPDKKHAGFGVMAYVFFAAVIFFSPALIRFSDLAYHLSVLPYRQLDVFIFLWLGLAFIFRSIVGMMLALFYALFFYVRFWQNMEYAVKLVFVLLMLLAMINFFGAFLNQSQPIQKKEQKAYNKNILLLVFLGIFFTCFFFGRDHFFRIEVQDVTDYFKTIEVTAERPESLDSDEVRIRFKSGVVIEGKIIFEDPFFYTVLDQKGKEHIALKEEIFEIDSLG